jgi:polar amino acid transport system substrate-binding protein
MRFEVMSKQKFVIKACQFLMVFCSLIVFSAMAQENTFNKLLPIPVENLAQDPGKQESKVKEGLVRVAAAECPPFIFFNDDGSTTGLTMFLWEKVANSLNIKYELTQVSWSEHIDEVMSNQFDIGLSCTTITALRLERANFTHSYFETYVSIVTKKADYFEQIGSLFKSSKFTNVVILFFSLSISISMIFYFLEHRVNDKIYAMDNVGLFQRIIEAFILGLLFITKGPFNYFEFKTLTGRVLAVFMSIFSTLFLASVTALLASFFTLGFQSNKINSVEALKDIRIGVQEGTTHELYARNKNISHISYKHVPEKFHAIDIGVIDAMINDDAVNRYQLSKALKSNKFNDLVILPFQFFRQNFGFVVSKEFDRLEAINLELLRLRSTQGWEDEKQKYYGDAYLN